MIVALNTTCDVGISCYVDLEVLVFVAVLGEAIMFSANLSMVPRGPVQKASVVYERFATMSSYSFLARLCYA